MKRKNDARDRPIKKKKVRHDGRILPPQSILASFWRDELSPEFLVTFHWTLLTLIDPHPPVASPVNGGYIDQKEGEGS